MLLSRNGRSADQARTENANCHCIADHDSQCYSYASISDVELDSVNSYQHANIYIHRDSNSDSYGDIYCYNFYAISTANLYIYTHSNQYADIYSDSNSNSNLDTDQDFDSFTYTYVYSDLYTHSNQYANVYANCISY